MPWPPLTSLFAGSVESLREAAYSGDVAATNPGIFRRKAGAAVAAVRRAGGMQAVDTMNHFLPNKEFIVPGSTYWNMVYGRAVGEVLRDEEGMANMRNLGENMAWLLKRLHGDEA